MASDRPDEGEDRAPELARVAKIADPLRRRLYFVAVLTKYLGGPTPPVVVGGHAVQFHTLGSYATEDIDLVYADRARLDTLLVSWGFQRDGRHWYSPQLSIAIEAPGDTLSGDWERVVPVRIGGLAANVVGVEDLIVDRLNAFVHWDSEEDGTWARVLLAGATAIDPDYLRAQCRAEGVEHALDGLLTELKHGTS